MLLTSIMEAQICEGLFTNNLNVTLNNSNNSLDVSGLDCDLCVYAEEDRSRSILDICECERENNECLESRTACREQCADDWIPSTGLEALLACHDECDLIFNFCENECDEFPVVIRTPISYSYTFIFWWSTLCSTSMTPDFDQASSSGLIMGAPGDPFSIPLNDDLSSMNVSYCYTILTTVFYDDGTCCEYFDEACLDIC